MKYGKLFKTCRLTLGLGQIAMAKRIKTSQAVVSKIEAGKVSPPLKAVIALLKNRKLRPITGPWMRENKIA